MEEQCDTLFIVLSFKHILTTRKGLGVAYNVILTRSRSMFLSLLCSALKKCIFFYVTTAAFVINVHLDNILYAYLAMLYDILHIFLQFVLIRTWLYFHKQAYVCVR